MMVLLTGATGFVGRFIWRRLVEAGNEVICVVRPSTQPPERMTFVHARLGHDECTQSLLKAAPQVDAVVHAAAHIDHQPFELELIDTNCRGTLQLLQYARSAGAKSFVYISGTTVIGKPQTSPILESHPVAPRSTYVASKQFGELLLGVVDEPNFSCSSLRLSAPVGPGMPTNRIMSAFIRRALQGDALQIAGKGTRRQNYIDVRDAAEAVMKCLERSPRGVFHVAGAEAISNRELAELCVRHLGSSSPIEFTGTDDAADDESWDISILAAKQAFGYSPKFSLVDSISAIANYIRGAG